MEKKYVCKNHGLLFTDKTEWISHCKEFHNDDEVIVRELQLLFKQGGIKMDETNETTVQVPKKRGRPRKLPVS